MQKIILTGGQQIGAQALDAPDGRAVRQHGRHIDFVPMHIARPSSADGIKLFQSKAERINLLVTLGTGGVTAVCFNQLSLGQIRGGLFRQHRHTLRRPGKLVTQQEFRHPVAPENRAGTGRPGLTGERTGHRQNASTRLRPDSFQLLPGIPLRAVQLIERRQLSVDKRVVSIQQAEYRAIIAEKVFKEANRLFIHVRPQFAEFRVVLFALFVQLIEVPHVKPLAAEFNRHPANPGIGQQPSRLLPQNLGLQQLSRIRKAAKFRIRQ